MAMPRLAGGTASTTRLSIRIWPAVWSSSPATIRSSVLLPQPEGPTNTTNSPSAMSRSMPLIASKSPKDLRTPCSLRDPTGCPSQIDGAAGAHALIGRQHNRQGLHGIRHVAGQIQIFADRLQHKGLLPVAQLLMARLVDHRGVAVGLGILPVLVKLRPVGAD